MSDDEERPNIVDMKQWKKSAQKKAEAEKKASPHQKPRLSNTHIQKLAIAVLVIAVVWLAMPSGYLTTLFSTVAGGN